MTYEINSQENGVPYIHCQNDLDFSHALGKIHATDRGMQMVLLRIIASGRICELLQDSEESLTIDVFMRKHSFFFESKKEVSNMSSQSLDYLQAYCDGVNEALKKRSPWEFKLASYKVEPWRPEDTLTTIKIMGYLGLAQTQQDMEKFIIKAIKEGTNIDALKALYKPHLNNLNEEIIDLIKKLKFIDSPVPDNLWMVPVIKASNNWVLSGKKTHSGQPIQCNDPHLETNRLPSIWYEAQANIGDQKFMGITMPGVPGFIMGRNQHLSFGFTYGFMDSIDYFIEDIQNDRFRDGDHYRHFNLRTEIIKRKDLPDEKILIRETHNGILESPNDQHLVDGLYLSRAWSGLKDGCAQSVDHLRDFLKCKNVKEAKEVLGKIFISCNWLLADSEGNIGYQQSGYLPKRKESGLFPLPGWDNRYAWKGIHEPQDLASDYNPESGFLVTANNDLNQPGKPLSINLPIASYRADRIKELIKAREKFGIQDMKAFQADVKSLQAQRYLDLIKPYIPETPSGRILMEWDGHYDCDSKGAYLFSQFYFTLMKNTFGTFLFSKGCWDYFSKNTNLFADFYGLFDDLLLTNTPEIDLDWLPKDFQKILVESLEETLSQHPFPRLKEWGEVNQIKMTNIFFQGKLPKWSGFDKGPYPLPGCAATIHQGSLYRDHDRETSFCPSWRFITDLGENNAYTIIPGGPSDRRFSPYYSNEVHKWLNFQYKVLIAH